MLVVRPTKPLENKQFGKTPSKDPFPLKSWTPSRSGAHHDHPVSTQEANARNPTAGLPPYLELREWILSVKPALTFANIFRLFGSQGGCLFLLTATGVGSLPLR